LTAVIIFFINEYGQDNPEEKYRNAGDAFRRG